MQLEEIEKFIQKQKNEYYPMDIDGKGLIAVSEKLLAIAKAAKEVNNYLVFGTDKKDSLVRLKRAMEDLEKNI